MSSVNTGNQLIYWRYKQELISSDLGKMLHNIIQPGVYSGGNITLDSGDTVNIAPLDVVCYTSLNQWVHIRTQDTVSLELSETDCYVTCQFVWVDSTTNYMDFTAKASGDILTTDVIIGKATYELSAITGFDYSEKTWGYSIPSSIDFQIKGDGYIGSSLIDPNPEGHVIYVDTDFAGSSTISSLYKACDGTVISDSGSSSNGKRIRNLNGEDVVLTVSWTADAGGAYATVPLTDVTALNVGDWVTGSGIAADTMIKAIDEDTGIISITDIAASGSISTTFNNDGIFVAGGSNTKVSGGDQMQRITGNTDVAAPTITTVGVFTKILEDAGIFASGAAYTRYELYFDSANSPDARTSATTAGRTKVHHRRLKAFMKIKMA